MFEETFNIVKMAENRFSRDELCYMLANKITFVPKSMIPDCANAYAYDSKDLGWTERRVWTLRIEGLDGIRKFEEAIEQRVRTLRNEMPDLEEWVKAFAPESFNVGDEVSEYLHGDGVVVSIDNDFTTIRFAKEEIALKKTAIIVRKNMATNISVSHQK